MATALRWAGDRWRASLPAYVGVAAGGSGAGQLSGMSSVSALVHVWCSKRWATGGGVAGRRAGKEGAIVRPSCFGCCLARRGDWDPTNCDRRQSAMARQSARSTSERYI